jgi:hypothetical protein
MQSSGEETEMKKDHLESLGVNGRTEVKQIIKNNWGKLGLDECGPGSIEVARSFV